MAYQKGHARHPDAGRAVGTKNKKTELLDGLARVYGTCPENAEEGFWSEVAKASQGKGPKGCLCTKVIADRLRPTLKSIEVSGSLAVEPSQMSELEVCERMVSMIMATGAELPALEPGENTPESAVTLDITPETAESASIVTIPDEEPKDDKDQEVTPL